MPEVTNAQLLKELRNLNARVGDVMRRVQQLEGKIANPSDRPTHVKSSRQNQPTGFTIENS